MRVFALVLLTLLFAAITYDSFQWKKGLKTTPFKTIANLWKGDLTYLSMKEKAKIQDYYASSIYGLGFVPWAFLVITSFILMYTIHEFFCC